MQQEWKGLNYCLRNLKLPWSSLLFLILIYYNLASEVWELLSLSTSQITRLTQKESGELSSGKRTLIAILLWYPGPKGFSWFFFAWESCEEPRSGEHETRRSPLREKKKNQEKPLGPGYYYDHFANRFSLRWKRKTKPGLKTLWEHWIWFSNPHALTQSCLPLFPP